MSVLFKRYFALLLALSVMLLSGFAYAAESPRQEYVILIGAEAKQVKKCSNIDVLVLEPDSFSAEDIQALHEAGIGEIYAYISIGSLESFRPYFKEYTDYILGKYENWSGEHWVDVSQPAWQELVASRVEELVAKGVDGFFVDNVDVYYLYPQEGIYDGIRSILTMMKQTGKKVIINGGDIFVKRYISEETDRIFDGVNQEDVYTRYDFSTASYTRNKQSSREYYTEYLDMMLENGYEVYVTEYARSKKIRSEALEYSKEHGYICYVAYNIQLK